MDSKELKSIIESLLFTWGDPLDIKDISSIVEVDEKEVSNIMQEMIDEFDYNMRGIKIIKINNSYQLGTRPENFQWIKKLANPKVTKNLSNAALETLSIIAYRQPIIKVDIEAIRGVRCDKAIETLIERGLIVEVGRLERVGRPILYGTTDVFLRCFGLESLEDLPPLNDVIDDIDNINTEK
ncbi:condensin subunit ScpB [Tissierella praeacuta DSM 18095]|uniref:Segregation and condensation protein B n=1 Tax=Tissierella praeacuta DSM 18095 TaxID=1123404 RepID=A0A1M4SEL7_9FIRM|nr:SMC-Scp complex subunit ScpB [Tissierella praeacuta]TCU72755.1 segregation and condensation protein B [Tissierella praeacuta]SHE30650.1 condensin subunit ScpB [Tissierella praeacuta DSM 18095]SUP01352.1 Segregation and condensation protein B [Tissierella praeacuta]